jgi:PKD repeat protein
MSNPFNDKIKESLENFEMPYDANAWAEFEKQLPQSGGAATGGSQLGWKAVALVAVLATSVATIWYLNSNKEVANSESVVVEQVEATQEQSPMIEENGSELSEPIILNEESNKISPSEKPQIADSKTIAEHEADANTEAKSANSENAIEGANSETQKTEKKTTPPVEKQTPKKVDAKPLVASFIASTINACVGEEVGFINESSDMKANMAWDFGDGTSSEQLNPTHTFVIAGNYSVALKTKKGSKVADKTVTILVNQSPTTTLETSQKLEGYDAIPFYHFQTVLQPNETATWKFSDGSIVNGSAATHLFRKGKSQVELLVRNNFGCTQSETWKTDSRQKDLLSYDAFSPDDNETNEGFMPKALPEMGVAFEMMIADSKGQEVYRTSNSSEPWNGKMKNNGYKLDAGVYVWTVVLKEEIVTNKTFTGTITLLR